MGRVLGLLFLLVGSWLVVSAIPVADPSAQLTSVVNIALGPNPNNTATLSTPERDTPAQRKRSDRAASGQQEGVSTAQKESGRAVGAPVTRHKSAAATETAAKSPAATRRDNARDSTKAGTSSPAKADAVPPLRALTPSSAGHDATAAITPFEKLRIAGFEASQEGRQTPVAPPARQAGLVTLNPPKIINSAKRELDGNPRSGEPTRPSTLAGKAGGPMAANGNAGANVTTSSIRPDSIPVPRLANPRDVLAAGVSQNTAPQKGAANPAVASVTSARIDNQPPGAALPWRTSALPAAPGPSSQPQGAPLPGVTVADQRGPQPDLLPPKPTSERRVRVAQREQPPSYLGSGSSGQGNGSSSSAQSNGRRSSFNTGSFWTSRQRDGS